LITLYNDIKQLTFTDQSCS